MSDYPQLAAQAANQYLAVAARQQEVLLKAAEFSAKMARLASSPTVMAGPAPSDASAAVFNFAEKLLAQQKAFAEEFLKLDEGLFGNTAASQSTARADGQDRQEARPKTSEPAGRIPTVTGRSDTAPAERGSAPKATPGRSKPAAKPGRSKPADQQADKPSASKPVDQVAPKQAQTQTSMSAAPLAMASPPRNAASPSEAPAPGPATKPSQAAKG